MTRFHTLLLLLAAGIAPLQASEPAVAPDQPFRLESGDFRWVTFTVHQTPTGVDCGFRVLNGNPTVHLELLPMSEFHLFNRGREHDTMAVTATGRNGEFRRVIDRRGEYAVVVVNEKNAPAAVVSLRVETTLNPGPGDIARTLSPERRLAVVGISLGFFIVSLAWSGHTLIRAMRRHRGEV